MAMKKTRSAVVTHVGRFPHYVYEDRDGVSTLTGITEQVQIVTEITDGPDAGREVRVRLTPDEAESHIRQVQDAIQDARRKQTEQDA